MAGLKDLIEVGTDGFRLQKFLKLRWSCVGVGVNFSIGELNVQQLRPAMITHFLNGFGIDLNPLLFHTKKSREVLETATEVRHYFVENESLSR